MADITSYRLTADVIEGLAEARRVQPEIRLQTSILWRSLDGHISCTHTIRSENDHEIAVTVAGSEVWSKAVGDFDIVGREAERLRHLFCD